MKSVIRATLLLSCLLLGGGIRVPAHSAPRPQPTAAAAQPNLVVRHLSAIGGQITGIAANGAHMYLAQAGGLTILDATDPQRIASLSRRAVANESLRSMQLAGGLV